MNMNSSIFRKSFSLNTSKIQTTPFQDLDIDETQFSVLRGEKLPINKILSRDSSFGRSSRIYYRSATIGVPFQWEKKPGTPMNPTREEAILQPPPPPPLPPAVQSLVLPRPKADMIKDSSLSWRFWLWWRRLSKNMRIQMYDRRGCHTKISRNLKGNKVSSSDGELDAELIGWIDGDLKSSSSSSSICLSNEQFESFRKGVPFCCTTWRRYKSNTK